MRIVDRIRGLFAKKDLNLAPVPQNPRSWWHPLIHEPFAGAWQRNMPLKVSSMAMYSTVYACLSRISGDIAKLPFELKQRDTNDLWRLVKNPAYSPVLRKPNHYQTSGQFRQDWILSKLMHGNTYALKMRDERGVVVKLFVLTPSAVTPMISISGDVYYQLNYSSAENLLPENYSAGQLIIPASEIIHDREATLWHPLIGIAPMHAATLAATKNVRIQENAARFFENGAQPGGILTAPAGMSDDDAKAVKAYWDENFSGENRGKVGVIGADMKFTAFAFNSSDSQMVEQLRYSDEQICHAFGIPPFKIGIGSIPAGMKVDDVNLLYLTDALQARIEAMEDCLEQGLGLSDDLGIFLSLEPLLRMDAQRQADVEGSLVKNGIKAPNEARKRFNLPPLTGGDSVYLQQQNFSLEALAKRDQSEDPFGKAAAPAIERTVPTPVQRASSDDIRDRMRYRYDWERGDWRAAA